MYALVHYRAWTSRSRRPRRHSETSCVPGLPTTTPVRTRPGDDEAFEHRRTWQRKLFEAGYAGFSWPKEYGGRGATMVEQALFGEEMARAKAPRR